MGLEYVESRNYFISRADSFQKSASFQCPQSGSHAGPPLSVAIAIPRCLLGMVCSIVEKVLSQSAELTMVLSWNDARERPTHHLEDRWISGRTVSIAVPICRNV